MLLPLDMTTLREELERWFESLNLKPMIVAEFEDSALAKEFGQNGYGIFAVPSVKEAKRPGDTQWEGLEKYTLVFPRPGI